MRPIQLGLLIVEMAMLVGSSRSLAAEPESVAVLDFASSDPGLRGQAHALGLLVATRLAQRPRARVVGCDALESCARLAEADDAELKASAAKAGVRWILRGRLDRFGSRFVFSASLLDTQTTEPAHRFRLDAADEPALPVAADRLGDTIAAALEWPPATGEVEIVATRALAGEPSARVNIKLGAARPSLQGFSVNTLALRLGLEGEVLFKPWLHGYLEVGILFGKATSDATGAQGAFSLVPAGVGLKYVFRSDKALRPFVGLGFGLGFFAALIDSTKGVAFRVDATCGLAWMVWERVGFFSELRAEVDTQRTYGLGANLGLALSF